MTTKITLSADAEVVHLAKQIAAEQDTTVSAMFARIIRAMAHRRLRNRKRTPNTRKASGLIKVPADKSYRELLEDAMIEKYEGR